MGARGQIFASRHWSAPAVLWVDDIVPEPDHDSGACFLLPLDCEFFCCCTSC